jgi:hypothetical protein
MPMPPDDGDETRADHPERSKSVALPLKVRVENRYVPIGLRLRLRLLHLPLLVGIGLSSIPKLIRLFKPKSPIADSADYITGICIYVDSIVRENRRSAQGRCLIRSLLIYSALCHVGVKSEFNILLQGDGVKLGHCWISIDGRPVHDNTQYMDARAELLCSDPPLLYWFPREDCGD